MTLTVVKLTTNYGMLRILPGRRQAPRFVAHLASIVFVPLPIGPVKMGRIPKYIARDQHFVPFAIIHFVSLVQIYTNVVSKSQ